MGLVLIFRSIRRQARARASYRNKSMMYGDRVRRNDPECSVNEDLNGSRERSWAPWSFSRVKYEDPPKTARYSSLFILPSVFPSFPPPTSAYLAHLPIDYRFVSVETDEFRWHWFFPRFFCCTSTFGNQYQRYSDRESFCYAYRNQLLCLKGQNFNCCNRQLFKLYFYQNLNV